MRFSIRPRFLPIATALGICSAFIAGCSGESDPATEPVGVEETGGLRNVDESINRSVNENQNRIQSWGDSLAARWDSTWEDLRGADFEHRDEVQGFFSRVGENAGEAFRELDESAEDLSGSARTRFEEMRDEAADAWNDVQDEFSELQEASSNGWTEAKEDVDEAWQRFTDKLRELREHVAAESSDSSR